MLSVLVVALEGLARDCTSSGEGRRVYPADVGFPPVFEQRQHRQSNGVGGKAPESEEEEVKPSRVVDHRGRGVTAQVELEEPGVAMVLYTEKGLFSEVVLRFVTSG